MTAQPTSMKTSPPLPLAQRWQQVLAALGRELACPLPDLVAEDYLQQDEEGGNAQQAEAARPNVCLNEIALRSLLAERGLVVTAASLPPCDAGDQQEGVWLAVDQQGAPWLLVGFDAQQGQVSTETPGAAASPTLDRSAIARLWEVQVADPADRRADDLHPQAKRHWLWDLLGGQRRWYRDLILASALVNILGLVVPLFTMNVYDRVVPNQAVETLWVLVSVVLIVLLFDWLLRGARARITDYAGRQIDVTVSQRLFEKLLGMELRHRPQSAAVFARQVQEFDAVRDFLTSATLVTLVDLPFALLFIGLIAWLAGPLFLVPLGAMVLLTAYAWVLRKRVALAIENGARYSSQRQAMLVETLQNLPDIKQTGLQASHKRRWRNLVSALADNSIDSRDAMNALSHAISSMQGLVTVLLIVFGVYSIAAGNLSMGGLIAVVMLSGRMGATVNQVSMLMLRAQHMKTALSALDTIMALPQERQLSTEFGAQQFDGHIRLQGVTFHWPEASTPALKQVDLQLRPGEKVAICGPSGSGKSTLLALLAGQMEPDSGRVLFAGVERSLWPMPRLRESFAFCGQHPGLFWGTLLENIVAGQSRMDEKRLLQALRNSGVESFLPRLENGMQYPVGEFGQHLSGGQRQAVALARTLLKPASVYLLDEPTSAMDQTLEQQVVNGLSRLPEDATLVIASHKPALLSICDRVIVLEDGEIRADGVPRQAASADSGRATRVTLRKPTPGKGDA